MNGKMTDRLIQILRPILNEEHPAWAANHLIAASNRQQAIGLHQFDYHIFTLSTTILQRDLEMVFVLDEIGPNYPLSAFLPLTQGQYDVLCPQIPHECVMGGVISAKRVPYRINPQHSDLDYICFADMHVILDYRNSVGGVFKAVSIMQKELVKFVDRHCGMAERRVRT